MSRKRSNINKNFMVFNAVLCIAVLFVCGIFLYLSFALKRDADKVMTYEGRYHIEIAPDFVGEAYSIYINDSLLLDGVMPDSLITLDVSRFAEEHVLMVVDRQTDSANPFNLSKEGGKVTVKKSDRRVTVEEVPGKF